MLGITELNQPKGVRTKNECKTMKWCKLARGRYRGQKRRKIKGSKIRDGSIKKLTSVQVCIVVVRVYCCSSVCNCCWFGLVYCCSCIACNCCWFGCLYCCSCLVCHCCTVCALLFVFFYFRCRTAG